jgi:hypothetical protein
VKIHRIKFAAGIVAALSGLLSPAAHADLIAHMILSPAFQVGTTAVVSFGVTVDAFTNLNSLWASAAYQIGCTDPKIRPAPQGGRAWSDNSLRGPSHITVTAPEWIPGQVSLPGWQSVMAGDYISCVLTARGSAKTNILPIGSGGSTIPIGGDSWDETKQQEFSVVKTGLGFGIGCIA